MRKLTTLISSFAILILCAGESSALLEPGDVLARSYRGIMNIDPNTQVGKVLTGCEDLVCAEFIGTGPMWTGGYETISISDDGTVYVIAVTRRAKLDNQVL